MESLFTNQLAEITERGNLRSLPQVHHSGSYIATLEEEKEMLNLSSNDYMGLATNSELRATFEKRCEGVPFSASSSRLLTGNFELYTELENTLCELYTSPAALVLNSGYHANTGVLPAITTARSLILADKLVHASLIDGIRLADAKSIRFRHNDLEQLERLLHTHAANHDRVVVVVESIYSMDGDSADLVRLVALKKLYPNVLLYVDEAHAVGAVGSRGLGYSEVCGCTQDIDILVGTFGKALASVGAYVICSTDMKQWLVNTMRTLIFTTALPPINLLWSLHVLQHISALKNERIHLANLGKQLREGLDESSQISNSHIVPVIVGESQRATALAKELQQEGYYVLPVRPPTVPVGTSRLRISLTAAITVEQVAQLIPIINRLR